MTARHLGMSRSLPPRSPKALGRNAEVRHLVKRPVDALKSDQLEHPMSTLSVSRQDAGLDSPGSSVFDLPIQGPLNPQEKDKHPLPSRPSLTLQTNHTTHDQGEPPSGLSFVVISGGTGGNAICSAFGTACHHALPVSDDGGSSSEIIRVLGGPSIGVALHFYHPNVSIP